MTQDDNLITALEETGIELALAQEVSASIELYDPEYGQGAPNLEALRVARGPGGDAVLKSVKPQNIVFNWKRFLQGAIAAASAETGSGHHLIDHIHAALTTIPFLIDVPQVVLGEAHSRVVLALWRDFPNRSDVSLDELAQKLDDISFSDLEDISNDLARLAVVRRRGNTLTKRERLVGEIRG